MDLGCYRARFRAAFKDAGSIGRGYKILVSPKKIAIAGSGYVGMSFSVLLAQHNGVTVLDIDVERVKKIHKRQSAIAGGVNERFLDDCSLSLRTATCK